MNLLETFVIVVLFPILSGCLCMFALSLCDKARITLAFNKLASRILVPVLLIGYALTLILNAGVIVNSMIHIYNLPHLAALKNFIESIW